MNDVNSNIIKRRARMDERKRELLSEARSARIEWIRGGGCSGGYASCHFANNDDETNLLNELLACSTDFLPCAPQIIESMLSSSNYSDGQQQRSRNGTLKHVLEEQSLSWELVSKKMGGEEAASSRIEDATNADTAANNNNSFLNLPPAPHPDHYASFLNTLCEPSSADLVMSTQKFCKTIREAASVMVSSMKDINDDGGTSDKPALMKTDSTLSSAMSTSSQQATINHGGTLAKAVRGFINKTMREMEEHESFQGYLHPQKRSEGSNETNMDSKPIMDAGARDQLLASLEKFVYGKCRGDIDMVLLSALEEVNGEQHTSSTTKTVDDMEVEMHDKMQSLQFVTPAHLEIQSLKSLDTSDDNIIDLSYTIEQIQSIHGLSSPRQMLQSILLAHRGVSVALNKACGHDNPPGADDVLPTLILATLRADANHLPSALRFIEHFAPLPLLRGEAGYAYTNLCGAIQFLKELDVDGHLAEVTLLDGGEPGERKSAVLHIGPEEFRTGLEECRRKMRLKVEEEEQMNKKAVGGSEEHKAENAVDDDVNDEECINGRSSSQVKIAARHVREARSQGETVDLDWAMKKQNEYMWKEGRVTDISMQLNNQTMNATVVQQHRIPPEEPPLPSQFSRSYNFLTTHPDNIGIRDLPRLLKEYKMLVHTTEKLLNERTVWRENERKRQLKLEREHLERDFVDVIGPDENTGNGNRTELANGH